MTRCHTVTWYTSRIPVCWRQHVPAPPPTLAQTAESSHRRRPRPPAQVSVWTGAARRRLALGGRRTSTGSTASWEMSGPSWPRRRHPGQRWHWRPHIEYLDERPPPAPPHPPLILYALRYNDDDDEGLRHRSVYIYPDAVPPIHAVSYHVATIRSPPKMATSSGLFLATIYNQSQLAERKHVARYWSINTVARLFH